MKYIFALSLIILGMLTDNIAIAQKKAISPTNLDKDTLGVYVNNKNQKVYLFGIFQVTQETINYKTQSGELAYESVNKVKWGKMGDRFFFGLSS